MKKISLFLKAKINLLALTFCALSTGFWMIVLARGYYYFVFPENRDNAYYAQTLWDFLHGSLSPSILSANFIVDHCYFLSFLIAPLYWIWPDPLLLQYLKIGAFFGAVYIFFLILKKYLHPLIALGAMLAFSLAPANISMLLGLFNYEIFAMPLILLIFKAMDDGNLKLYIICCFLLAMVKEQMPLVVMMLGILAFFYKSKERNKWALLPFAAGLIIFIFEVFILTPYLRRDLPMSADHYWMRYIQFGKTPQEILFFLLTHPARILEQCFLPENIHWYNNLFGIWGFLAFFSPQILLVALPLFLKAILSSNHQEHDILYLGFYASTLTPFIYLAAWNTLNYIQNKWRLALHLLVLTLMLIHAFLFIPQRLPYLHLTISNNALARQHFIDKIPLNASVLTSSKTYSPLANRKELYPVFIYLSGSYLVSGKKFELPEHTDYLLLDFADEWLLNQDRKKYTPKMTALNFDDRWRLQKSIEDIALYVRNPSRQKTARLIEKSFQPFLVNNISFERFDRTLSLEAVEFPKEFSQEYRIFPVTMYWECLKSTNVPYAIAFNITSNGKSYYTKYRSIGSTIYPTYFWRQGEHVKESYFYLLPPMPPGNFDMEISIYNTVSKKLVGAVVYGVAILKRHS